MWDVDAAHGVITVTRGATVGGGGLGPRPGGAGRHRRERDRAAVGGGGLGPPSAEAGSDRRWRVAPVGGRDHARAHGEGSSVPGTGAAVRPHRQEERYRQAGGTTPPGAAVARERGMRHREPHLYARRRDAGSIP